MCPTATSHRRVSGAEFDFESPVEEQLTSVTSSIAQVHRVLCFLAACLPMCPLLSPLLHRPGACLRVLCSLAACLPMCPLLFSTILHSLQPPAGPLTLARVECCGGHVEQFGGLAEDALRWVDSSQHTGSSVLLARCWSLTALSSSHVHHSSSL